MKKVTAEEISSTQVSPPPTPVGQPLPPTAQNADAPGQPYREDPGQTFGIIGIVLNAIGFGPGGIIFGVLARNKSRAAGFSPTLGTVSLIWGIVNTALGTLLILFYIGLFIFMATTGDAPRSPTMPTQNGNEYGPFELNI